MPELNLTQSEADALIAMAKHRTSDQRWVFPGPGEGLSIPLASDDRRELFMLDLHIGRIDLTKSTYQNRARAVLILVRLDFGGRPHRNPDGEEVASPHLHLYREGYGDKWAIAVPPHQFPHLTDRRRSVHDFMRYCNIVTPPFIDMGLFS